MFHFDFARAVVDSVCDVCTLGADVANLSDEANAAYVGAVNLVIGFGIGLCCVEGLLDCDGAECGIIAVCALFAIFDLV